MTDPAPFESLACPAPLPQDRFIVLGHGSGGTLSHQLIQNIFLPAFSNPVLDALEDQATLDPARFGGGAGRIALTTDSFVVRPIFFPGGDIGSLAVHGTINDLAVGGAEPVCIAAAFILEEGLTLDDLRRICASVQAACREAGVTLVTGDTKVVDRGKGDQVYITTTGLGVIPAGRDVAISAGNARPGDRVLVSGTIGDHGIAVMSVREGISFGTPLRSDSAPLSGLTRAMLGVCPRIHCMRDPTRGGVSSALNEIAAASGVGMKLTESALPIRAEVRAACEMLGLDPLYVANEGKLIAIVPPVDAGAVLAAMRSHPLGRDAADVGDVVADHAGVVTLKSLIGGERVVAMLAGEQLPRIC
ncbi:MAG: hydrogenase expression/formation protein HypE [Phycisphaerales bacterium]|nr:MAG: hydrogenase expression/formation protein HypE [Phycisphaerales bacterium]